MISSSFATGALDTVPKLIHSNSFPTCSQTVALFYYADTNSGQHQIYFVHLENSAETKEGGYGHFKAGILFWNAFLCCGWFNNLTVKY